jgi:hypothetical protein
MKKFYFVVLGLILVAIGVFLAKRQVKTSTYAPPPITTAGVATPTSLPDSSGLSLSITSPISNATVSGTQIIVKGKTAPKADVFINEAETKADASGNFQATVALDEGDNIISISANDASGNYAEQEITVISTQ